MHAAGVELDPLPDTIRPGAEDHHFAASRRFRFVLPLVRRIQIWRRRFEFCRARVHPLVHRTDPLAVALFTHIAFGPLRERCDLFVGEAVALPFAIRGPRSAVRDFSLHLHDLPDLTQKPRIDRREGLNIFDRHSGAEGVADGEDALRSGGAEQFRQRLARRRTRIESARADLQRAQPLLQRLVERAPDGHRLAHRLHRQTEKRRRLAELLEGEARNLDHDVIDGRLERGRRLACDVIGNLVERESGGELRRKLGDGKAGCFRRQS